MDEVWEAFNQHSGIAYVAENEKAVTLCASALTVQDALRRMADLLESYEQPVVLASTLYWEKERYYTTVVISGTEF